jgi:hypothetical protein
MADFEWYVIKYPLPRTGVQQVTYVDASSAQQAAETEPGATVLMGPYDTEADAENAFNNSSTGKSYNANPHSPKSSGVNGPAATESDLPDTPWAGLIAALTSRNTWIRVAEVVIGGGLVIVAISHLAANTQAGQTIISAGKKAAVTAAAA